MQVRKKSDGTEWSDGFSILIGSGGDARHHVGAELLGGGEFQYPHRIGW